MSSPKTFIDNTLKTSFLLTLTSMFSQILIRLLSFALNVVLLRISSTKILGIVNVKLTLLYETILFLAREPNRKVHARKGLVKENYDIFRESTVYSLAILSFCMSLWLFKGILFCRVYIVIVINKSTDRQDAMISS